MGEMERGMNKESLLNKKKVASFHDTGVYK
jgi:hypothetical protein